MKETLEPNFLFTGMNMFMPDIVKVKTGSVLTWFNSYDVFSRMIVRKRNFCIGALLSYLDSFNDVPIPFINFS